MLVGELEYVYIESCLFTLARLVQCMVKIESMGNGYTSNPVWLRVSP